MPSYGRNARTNEPRSSQWTFLLTPTLKCSHTNSKEIPKNLKGLNLALLERVQAV